MILQTIINTTGGGGGAKIATGTATAIKESTSDFSNNYYLEVTGLDFQPTNFMAVRTASGSQKIGLYNTFTVAGSTDYDHGETTVTFTANGFKVVDPSHTGLAGHISGTYYWVAWVE